MVHAKDISVVEKEKGYEVRFNIGFDKGGSKDKLPKSFPQRMVIGFNAAADQAEIENKIKIEIGRLRMTYAGKKQDTKPTDKTKVDALNAYFNGKTVK